MAGKNMGIDIGEYAFKYRSILFVVIFIIGWAVFPGPSVTGYLFVLYHLSIVQLKAFVIALSLVGIAGFFIRIWGSGYIGASIVQSSQLHGEALITSGPYAYMRDPLYFGSLLIVIGFLPVLPPWGFVFIIVAMGALIYLLIRAEEGLLSSTHKEEFLKYKSTVHALIPTPRKISRSSAKFELGEGLRSEVLYIFIFSPLIGGLFLPSTVFASTFYTLLITGIILRVALRSRANEVEPAAPV